MTLKDRFLNTFTTATEKDPMPDPAAEIGSNLPAPVEPPKATTSHRLTRSMKKSWILISTSLAVLLAGGVGYALGSNKAATSPNNQFQMGPGQNGQVPNFNNGAGGQMPTRPDQNQGSQNSDANTGATSGTSPTSTDNVNSSI